MWLGLGAHFLVQLALPLRHHLYAGNMCWTEQGFRFAWHVMLVEKGGLVRYRVHDAASNREWLVYPRDYLAPHQQKAMATQPDMILQLAHHIARDYTTRLGAPVEVRADAFVAFNGRRSQRLIDPDVDLTTVEDGLAPKPWILPLRSEL